MASKPLSGATAAGALTPSAPPHPAKGPLRVLASNPRYFTADGAKAVFLTGSHTWNNLQEIVRPPAHANPVIDYGEFLSFLASRGHNCFRLWAWENAASFDAQGQVAHRQDPMPFFRAGPGNAADGLPRFDLTRLNPAYFERLRQRVLAAREGGMYVIIMLFQGFSITRKDQGHGDPWTGHPFRADNNVNGLDGDPNRDGNGLQTHWLTIPAVTAVQEAYVRKVIETVSDCDNVLYEITNEDDGSAANTRWQCHMISFIKRCEAAKPSQHPVGMSVQYPHGRNEPLLASPADWISPSAEGGYQTDPPVSDGSKVIVNDTDHSFYYIALQKAGQDAQRAWVWKNFTRGNCALFMDPYLDPLPWDHAGRNNPQGGKPDPYWDVLRLNMGYTRMYADKMNLAAMVPQPALASSGFCLASMPAHEPEYLVYLPQGPWVTVELPGVRGSLAVEWFSPSTGAVVKAEPVAGGARRALTAPFAGDAVLCLSRTGGQTNP